MLSCHDAVAGVHDDLKDEGLPCAHLLNPFPTCGEMLVSLKVSSSAFCDPLWLAAGACAACDMHRWGLRSAAMLVWAFVLMSDMEG